MKLPAFKHTNPIIGDSFLNISDTVITQNLLEKFVNLLMKNGDKLKASKILYKALETLYKKNVNNVIKTNKKKKTDSNSKFSSSVEFVFAKQLMVTAIYNVRPSVQLRAVKVAGRTHQVPAVIYEKKQNTLAMKWLIESALINKKRGSNLDFSDCLAIQLFQALRKFGKVRQKRDALHKLAESNRASLRFRWW